MSKEADRRYREANRELIRERQREFKRRRRAEDPEYFQRYYQEYHLERRKDPRAIALMFIGKAQKRANEKGWDFDLFDHFDEIVARIGRWKCEMTGIQLVSNPGKKKANSISIDRIDASEGYVYSNIRIIAWGLNAAFSDWGEVATLKLMKRLIDRMELI